MREAVHIVEQGVATPEDVDEAMRWGLALRWTAVGPFQINGPGRPDDVPGRG